MTLFTVFATYLLLGALAGTLAGLFGIGGGLIIVPVLIFSFELQGVSPEISAHLAVGTSLATIVFTSLSSIRSHHQRGAVRWDLFRPMTVGIVVGAVLGAWTAAFMTSDQLQLVIGTFVILVGLKMLLEFSPKPGRDVPGPGGTRGGRCRHRLGIGDFWYWRRHPDRALPELVQRTHAECRGHVRRLRPSHCRGRCAW